MFWNSFASFNPGCIQFFGRSLNSLQFEIKPDAMIWQMLECTKCDATFNHKPQPYQALREKTLRREREWQYAVPNWLRILSVFLLHPFV